MKKINWKNLALLLMHIVSGVGVVSYLTLMTAGIFKGFSLTGYAWIEFLVSTIIFGVTAQCLSELIYK